MGKGKEEERGGEEKGERLMRREEKGRGNILVLSTGMTLMGRGRLLLARYTR